MDISICGDGEGRSGKTDATFLVRFHRAELDDEIDAD
jgi:hypothetical protein